MNMTNPKVKQLIFDVINFSDEVDEKGATLPRKTFKKEFYKTIVELNKKLDDNAEWAVDVEGVMNKAKEEGRKTLTAEEVATIVYKAKKDVGEGDAIFVSSIRFTEAEMELTEAEKKAIKYYWEECSEIKDVGIEALDEFEALLA